MMMSSRTCQLLKLLVVPFLSCRYAHRHLLEALGWSFSDIFGGEDVGMSGMAAPPTSDKVIGYPDDWLMDESSQLNP
jgi:hypothetical protein